MLECALAKNIARYLATVETPEAIYEGSVARALALPGEFVADVLGQRWARTMAGEMARETSRASAIATARALEREGLAGGAGELPREHGGGAPPLYILTKLIAARQCCRRQRDFPRADGFRDALEGWGFRVDDETLTWRGPDGIHGRVPNPVYYQPRARSVGDWDCPNCDSLVYSHRPRCWKCYGSNPAYSDGRGRSPLSPAADGRAAGWSSRASSSAAADRRGPSSSRGRSRSVGRESPRASRSRHSPPRAAAPTIVAGAATRSGRDPDPSLS